MLIMTKEIDTCVLYHTNSVIGRRQTPTEPAAADITGTAPGPAPSQLKQVCVCVCVCVYSHPRGPAGEWCLVLSFLGLTRDSTCLS
jgi:hypothetical protein